MKIKQLRQQRAALVESVDKIFAAAKAEERATLNDEERASLDTAEGQIATLDGQIDFEERAERAALRKKNLDEPMRPVVPPGAAFDVASPVSEETRLLAVQAYFRTHSTRRSSLRLTSKHQEACAAVGIDPTDNDLVLNLLPTSGFNVVQEGYRAGTKAESRLRASNAFRGISGALTTHTAVSGGSIMTPESMLNRFEVNMLAFGGMLQVSEIVRSMGREPMRWPAGDDTSNSGERLGESTAVSNADPTFSQMVLNLYKYGSKAIYVPYELLDGSAFDLANLLADWMSERIARKMNSDFTVATGASSPYGIVNRATTFSAASATAISWADIGNLIASVDPAYRAGASFMFHDSIRNDIQNILDGDGHPMWLQGPNGTEPALLRGYPWTVNQAMASSASSGAKTILFGQLGKYKIRMHNQLRIRRLTEVAALSDQDVFVAFLEGDGNLLNAGTAPVKVLTH